MYIALLGLIAIIVYAWITSNKKGKEVNLKALNIAKQYGVDVSECKDENERIHKIYINAFGSCYDAKERLKEEAGATTEIVDTFSSLGYCMRSADAFYFEIGEKLGMKALDDEIGCKDWDRFESLTRFLDPNLCLDRKFMQLDNIIMYKVEGTKHYVSDNSQINTKGAIVGEILGGTAGAIIGSRAGTSGVREVDERKLNIYYYNDGNVVVSQIFCENIDTTFEILRKLIPEKDGRIVDINKQ